MALQLKWNTAQCSPGSVGSLLIKQFGPIYIKSTGFSVMRVTALARRLDGSISGLTLSAVSLKTTLLPVEGLYRAGHKHWGGGDKEEGALFYTESSGKFDLVPAK